MYLYGGMWEETNGRERLAMDDLWSMDVTKLDEWTCLHVDSGIGEEKFQGDDTVGGEGAEGGHGRRSAGGGEG